MYKLKLFLENFLIYGIGGIISRAVPVIMIPIIARLMPSTKEFGIIDLSNTLTALVGAFALLGMYDGLFRMYFEKEDEKYKIVICSSAFTFVMLNSFIVCAIIIFFRKEISLYFYDDYGLDYLVIISALTAYFNSIGRIVASPTRMQNRRFVYLAVNTVSSIVSYLFAILLLLEGYYLISLPISLLLSDALVSLYYYCYNKKWFHISLFEWEALKQMLIISLPLFPSVFVYWIFNSSDRLMITNLLGVESTGVYSAGTKLGHFSYLIYTAFAGGWQFFAYSTMRDKNQVESNSNVFEYLGVISFVSTALICMFSYSIFIVMFPEEYLGGFLVSPYLFLAPLLQMLFQVCSTQFIIIKRTWMNLLLLFFGALTNIFINLILIPELGIEGAAIGTSLGYLLSIILSVIMLHKMGLFSVSKRFIVVSCSFLIYFYFWRLFWNNNIWNGMPYLFLFLVLCKYLYSKELSSFLIAFSNKS